MPGTQHFICQCALHPGLIKNALRMHQWAVQLSAAGALAVACVVPVRLQCASLAACKSVSQKVSCQYVSIPHQCWDNTFKNMRGVKVAKQRGRETTGYSSLLGMKCLVQKWMSRNCWVYKEWSNRKVWIRLFGSLSQTSCLLVRTCIKTMHKISRFTMSGNEAVLAYKF